MAAIISSIYAHRSSIQFNWYVFSPPRLKSMFLFLGEGTVKQAYLYTGDRCAILYPPKGQIKNMNDKMAITIYLAIITLNVN